VKNVGITTTVPIEVLIAGGYRPLDLNNLFIGDPHPEELVSMAERKGFPQASCTWIKGIYGACQKYALDTILYVTHGDCSGSLELAEVLRSEGKNCIPFPYPDFPHLGRMQEQLENLASALGTSLEEAEGVRRKILPYRVLSWKLDELTWKEDLISSWENHLFLVSTSDFEGSFEDYRRKAQELITGCGKRKPYPPSSIRLGYIGVPPIFARSLYYFLEGRGARVVFNELQYQFSMPSPGGCLAQQYIDYTYPYSSSYRLRGILSELRKRKAQGVIHYVQSFCHRQISDIVFRKEIDLPILTLEGNTNYTLDQQAMTKVEAFIDMVRRRRE